MVWFVLKIKEQTNHSNVGVNESESQHSMGNNSAKDWYRDPEDIPPCFVYDVAWYWRKSSRGNIQDAVGIAGILISHFKLALKEYSATSRWVSKIMFYIAYCSTVYDKDRNKVSNFGWDIPASTFCKQNSVVYIL